MPRITQNWQKAAIHKMSMEGVSAPKIAQEFGISLTVARRVLASPIPTLDTDGRPLFMEQDITKRTCLKCLEPFPSRGPLNRICRSCTEKNNDIYEKNCIGDGSRHNGESRFT